MNEHNSRAAIVERVARAARAWRVEDPAPFAWTRSSSPREAIVARFAAAAERADASVSVAADFDAARQRIAEILRAAGARKAIVADTACGRPWDVERLAGAPPGCEIARVSALTESTAATMSDPALAGITPADYAMAETGTLVMCSGPTGGRAESLVPPVHIALVRSSAVVAGLPDLLAALGRDRRLERSSAVTFVTGPSRTADIELTLTIGVHGPKQLFIVLVDDRPERDT